MSSISTAGLTLIMNSALLRQQNTLSLLSQQLSSSKQHGTLTEYTPTEAHNILDLQNGVTQREGYNSAISNVQQRLSMYDTTMADVWYSDRYRNVPSAQRAPKVLKDIPHLAGICRTRSELKKQLGANAVERAQ